MTPLRYQALKKTNHRLREWLDRVALEKGKPRPITPELITILLSDLSRAGAELRAEPLPRPGTDLLLDAELESYRTNVHRLRQVMPAIRSQLLVERARLETQRARMQSAAAWARASRHTFWR